MSARPEHEDDGNATEMSNLQDAPKESQDSQAGLHGDPERQDYRKADRDQNAAYRKLYAIVTVMTMILFGLNIAQVCLLPVISNLYWIVLFPGVIFLAFIAWAWIFVATNSPTFFGHLGGFSEGRRRALQHLGALFFIKSRSRRSYEGEYRSSGPSWPRRFERTGIFITIFLNIILCQFIYLPVFAVPAFEEIIWKMELNATQSISTPSFALLQNTELARRATLEDDPESIEKMCKEKEEDDVFRNLFCFKHLKDDLTYGDNDDHHARYVTFDGRQYPGISMGTNLGLWYQYYYDSTASADPLLGLVPFDTNLIDVFEEAFKCGLITSTSFPAGDRNQASLRQVTINDKHNAMGRTGNCSKDKRFDSYNIYETDIIPLGEPSAPGPNICDLSRDYNGSCNADLTVSFPSTLTRVYTSEHGKDWITILTEEGGVVGFVTFLTWFFGIFNV